MLGYWDDNFEEDGKKEDVKVIEDDEEKDLQRLTLNEFKKMMSGEHGHSSVITRPVGKWRDGIESFSVENRHSLRTLSNSLTGMSGEQ